MISVLYIDEYILICEKPQGILSTDEPGGLPSLLREQLGIENLRTVHRLDQVTGGLMVLARKRMTASLLSAQISSHRFSKIYLAAVHGKPPKAEGTLHDFLFRDKITRTTLVVPQNKEHSQEARLNYTLVSYNPAENISLVRVKLQTGRTHQIRVQFSSRNLPLVGDRKYGITEDDCPLALWSSELLFIHPKTELPLHFISFPDKSYPWNKFTEKPFTLNA